MTNFTAVQDIPDAPNNPSSDQPNMKTNTNSMISIWDVDHIGFNVSNGGTHEQVSFYQNVAGALGTAVGLIFPNTRPASWSNSTGSGNASLQFLSQDASTLPLPLSCIKAGGNFTGTSSSGAISFNTQFNCTAISSNGSGTYTITIATGVTTGSNIICFVNKNTSSNGTLNWTYVNPTLTVNGGAFATSGLISFIIFQV